MSKFRRYYVPDSIVFITSITKNRNPLFLIKQNREIFLSTIDNAAKILSFDLIAYALLPDHFHLLIKTKDSQGDFSKIIKCIKGNFTKNFKDFYHLEKQVSLWQPKFWDHVIRNDNDFNIHLDYIHWNPVKHGLVNDPGKWEYSSFQKWVGEGLYPEEWGELKEPRSIRNLNFE
jgi:putative transposase